MREIILTDIHGCYEEMIALLKEVQFCNSDIIVGASDCVDKGPDSARVIKFLKDLSDQDRLIHVKGNHEVKFLRFAKRYKKDPAKAMQHKHAESMLNTLTQLSDSDLEWLSRASLVAYLNQYPGVVIHAGIEPGLTKLPEYGSVDDSSLGDLSHLIYCRYIENGKMLRLGEEKKDSVFWADAYDGRFGHVFYGHQPWLQALPRLTNNTTGLDLGCVVGGRLAAAVLEGGKVHYASVPGAPYTKPYLPKE